MKQSQKTNTANTIVKVIAVITLMAAVAAIAIDRQAKADASPQQTTAHGRRPARHTATIAISFVSKGGNQLK